VKRKEETLLYSTLYAHHKTEMPIRVVETDVEVSKNDTRLLISGKDFPNDRHGEIYSMFPC
jgi:hypothetical protein